MQKSLPKWIIFAVVALHLAITIPSAYYLNIWVDEASSLYATEHGFWIAFKNAAAEQKQAPLYFWVLSLWRTIDSSIFFARLFSVVCSVAAIILFRPLASRVASRNGVMLLTAFFGLHPFLVWASLEIRVYSLVILLTIVLIRSFFSVFWDHAESSGTEQIYRNIGFLLAAIISLYTNYYLGFLIAGLFAVLIFSGRWRAARRYVLLMALAGVAFLPMVFQMAAELGSKSGGYQEERSLTEGIRILWHHFLTFVFPTELFPASEQSMMSFFRVWIVRAAVVFMTGIVIWQRKRITPLTRSLSMIVIVIGVFVLTAYFLIGSQYTHIRHMSVLFVPLLLCLASLTKDIWPPEWADRSRAALAAGALVAAVIFAYSIRVIYPEFTKRGDWARVAAFIQENESPGQPIVTFEAFDALALPYYYRGPNRIFPDNNYFDFGLQAPDGTEKSMVRQNEFVISEIPDGSTSIWLVVNEACTATDACRPLENYVQANYTIELEREFYISKVYLLKTKSP